VTTPPDGPLARYAERLATTAIEWGLLGPAEAGRIWDRHIANSLALAPLLPAGATVLDVGSGAGLPGIPLALERPDLTVTLLEPLDRRARFLAETVVDLGVGQRVTVVRSRAEDYRTPADVVVARAVAPLARLVGWTRHLFPAGELLALKGAKAAAEVAAAERDLGKWGLEAEIVTVEGPAGADGVTGAATVVRVRAGRGATT
jgi:16S rRNA (guanine527-N7)-methyltransferase